MIIDLNSLDLVKAITRTEAKSVHKDLPPGGAWRTIKGHHIYIKDGKVLAGSIPGVTKAKKATKAQLADHQAAIDAEGKKKDGNNGKSKGTPKAKGNAKQAAGGSAKGKGGAKGSKDSGSGAKASGSDKVASKGKKANETAKVGAKSAGKAKAKSASKSGTNGKSVSGAKKASSEGSPKSKPAATEGAIEQAKELAKQHEGLFDWLDALTAAGMTDAMREHVKTSGKTLKELHDEWGDHKDPATEGTGANKVSEDPSGDNHYELYHGTMLPNLDAIMKNGFKLNGGHSDFGHAAYFKSPAFDPLDHAEHQKWLDERKAQGLPIPERYLTQDIGNDSAKIVRFFTDNKEPLVIKAFVPKEHLLDCSKGRPAELQSAIDDYKAAWGDGNRILKKQYVLKHLLGIEADFGNVEDTFDAKEADIKKAWGRDFKIAKASPYEVYARKHGVKAIVDQLDTFRDEGWQIGVYDPSIIQIRDHGKKLEYNHETKRAELLKALLKELRKNGGAIPYCLLHHEIDDEGLHLHVGAQGGESMEKSLTRTDAKKVHKDLPPGGEWRTIKGHHIYIKDGKVLAGSIPGVTTKAKKATKAQLKEHQETIDAEAKAKKKIPAPKKKEPAKKEPQPPGKASKAKGAKTDDKKVSPKPKATATGKKRSSTAKSAPATDTKTPASTKKQGGTKKPKDIRSDAQKNRELAYDVGDKVGGARKDEFIASFKEKPTAKSLEELEKMSGAIAEKMVTKANLLPKFDFQSEHDNGVDLPTAILKKLIQDRIAPKPEPSTPETRKAYMTALNKVNRHFAGIKSFDNMRDALREMSTMARKAYHGRESQYNLDRYKENPSRWSYFNTEYHEQRIADGKEAAKFMDFTALGDKFHNLLTNYESLNRSIDTVRKNTKEGWDKYLTPQAKAAPKKRGEENKRWEREAVAEHLRKGGKETKVKKPEDLMKEFNLRGVEFGNWVNDSSGLFHLKRSAEAFDDLADIVGIDKKDISLNGRLAIAFGARGKGGALAHYEPDRKVINMTKHGGAGSLAHEWGHAMDNILHQYSNGGQESLGLASQGQMGDADPKLKALYSNLMDAITKPAPGDKGGSTQMLLDSSVKQLTRYYPEMRRQVEGGMEPVDVYHHWASKVNEQYDRYVRNAQNSPYNRTQADIDKAVKKYEQKRKRELTDIGHYLASELRRKQNGGKYGGDHYKGHIEIPTGKSEYLTRMEETQSGKQQNGVHYWSAPEEMFARVFESYVQETMKKAKRENNYLVHGTGEGHVKVEGAPFPLGKERQHMFKAMKNLLDYVGKKGTLKKALILEVLASGSGDLTEKLRKSFGSDTGVMRKRSAYNVANPSEVLYIPVNRLKVVYQTDAATNWDKVEENRERMEAGENLEPVVIGLNYDIHDGHHRYEASKLMGYEHIPCVVKGGNDLDRERALEAYREVWKSIQPDPTEPYADVPNVMFRGVGVKELYNIKKTGFIQSKGKGNDEDKGVSTCFSNLYSQAEGYARSNYDLYHELSAYVLVVRKPEDIEEDEHGELIAHRPIPIEDLVAYVYIPKPDIMKSFDESKHPRDAIGRFRGKTIGELDPKVVHALMEDHDYDTEAQRKVYRNNGDGNVRTMHDEKKDKIDTLHWANKEKFSHIADHVTYSIREGLSSTRETAQEVKKMWKHLYMKARSVAKENPQYAEEFNHMADYIKAASEKAVRMEEEQKLVERNWKHNDAMKEKYEATKAFSTSGVRHDVNKTLYQLKNQHGFGREKLADHIYKITEGGKKPFTLSSKNVSITFNPKSVTHFDERSDGRVDTMKFSLDIKTPTSEINGASFSLTAHRRMHGRHGRLLPKRLQNTYDGSYSVYLDFPKTKGKVPMYRDPYDANGKLEDMDMYMYKNPEVSTKENIEKTAELLMRMTHAHWEQEKSNPTPSEAPKPKAPKKEAPKHVGKPINPKWNVVPSKGYFSLKEGKYTKQEDAIHDYVKSVLNLPEFDRPEDEPKLIAKLKEIGFERTPKLDDREKRASLDAYTAEFSVNPNKKLIIRVGIGKTNLVRFAKTIGVYRYRWEVDKEQEKYKKQ